MANKSAIADIIMGTSSEAKKGLVDKINQALDKMNRDLNKNNAAADLTSAGVGALNAVAPAIETKKQKAKKQEKTAKLLGDDSIYSNVVNKSKIEPIEKKTFPETKYPQDYLKTSTIGEDARNLINGIDKFVENQSNGDKLTDDLGHNLVTGGFGALLYLAGMLGLAIEKPFEASAKGYANLYIAVKNKIGEIKNKKTAKKYEDILNQITGNTHNSANTDTKNLNEEVQKKIDSLIPYKKELSLQPKEFGGDINYGNLNNGMSENFAAMGMPFSAAVWNLVTDLSKGSGVEKAAAPVVGAVGAFAGGAADIITKALTWSNNGYKRIYNHIVDLINQKKVKEAEELLNAIEDIKNSNLEYQKAFDEILKLNDKSDDLYL